MPRGDSPAVGRPRVLLVRIDKIGDLVSTMPVDEVFHPDNYDAAWVISKGLGFLAEEAIPPRRAFEIAKEDREAFRKILEDFKPDVVVDFYGPWWVSFEAWKAGVKIRAGRKSRWASFVFLNHGLRQSRSLSEKHEADYNLDLAVLAREAYLRSKNIPVPAAPLSTPVLELQAPEHPELLEKYDLIPENYIVIHAGMAGSALNWPTSNYAELVHRFLQLDELEDVNVVFTGTPADEPYLKPLREALPVQERLIWLDSKLNIRELLYVLQESACVLAPSTGVLHLAASLGVHSVGLYSPVKAQAPTRWKARGDSVTILVPPVLPSEITPDCMGLIPVDEVLAEIERAFE